jgi:hypothetical protein
MKTYFVNVPREKRITFTVQAEDSRDARFEAIRTLVSQVICELIPLDIIEGEEVYQCVGCAQYFDNAVLSNVEGKLYCGLCDDILIKGLPDPWS